MCYSLVFVLVGALTLCFLPPAEIKPVTEDVEESPATPLMNKKVESMGILEGVKNCYYLLTTPKFILLTFTMFANGRIV